MSEQSAEHQPKRYTANLIEEVLPSDVASVPPWSETPSGRHSLSNGERLPIAADEARGRELRFILQTINSAFISDDPKLATQAARAAFMIGREYGLLDAEGKRITGAPTDNQALREDIQIDPATVTLLQREFTPLWEAEARKVYAAYRTERESRKTEAALEQLNDPELVKWSKEFEHYLTCLGLLRDYALKLPGLVDSLAGKLEGVHAAIGTDSVWADGIRVIAKGVRTYVASASEIATSFPQQYGRFQAGRAQLRELDALVASGDPTTLAAKKREFVSFLGAADDAVRSGKKKLEGLLERGPAIACSRMFEKLKQPEAVADRQGLLKTVFEETEALIAREFKVVALSRTLGREEDERMEILDTQPADANHPAETVAEVIEPGYVWSDPVLFLDVKDQAKTIKPLMVISYR